MFRCKRSPRRGWVEDRLARLSHRPNALETSDDDLLLFLWLFMEKKGGGNPVALSQRGHLNLVLGGQNEGGRVVGKGEGRKNSGNAGLLIV